MRRHQSHHRGRCDRDGVVGPSPRRVALPQGPGCKRAAAVRALDSYFPRRQGRYIFGPLAKIGWGDGIVEGEIALLLELPEPLKLLAARRDRGRRSDGEAAARAAHLLRRRHRLRQEARVLRRDAARLADRELPDQRRPRVPLRLGRRRRCSRSRSAGSIRTSSRPPAFPTLKRLAHHDRLERRTDRGAGLHRAHVEHAAVRRARRS